jgi:pimeloyl-ACP methyl ester carboxylesterase
VKLWHAQGGSGGPTLVLLHGLGANADVWKKFASLWEGRWIAPDLRGHGRSAHQPPYSYGAHAADVAALLSQDEEIFVVGHSMGGVIAMALASGWYGIRVRSVVAFGVKIRWTGDEVAKLHALARAQARWFDTQAEAVERYLKVSGLIGLLDPSSAEALSGVCEENGRFRLAADPMINAVAGPDIAAFVAAAKSPVRFAAGSKDPMVSAADMQAFDPNPFIFDGAGHNVHVEQPEALMHFVRTMIAD